MKCGAMTILILSLETNPPYFSGGGVVLVLKVPKELPLGCQHPRD